MSGIEFRWILPDCTTTEGKILQYRTAEIRPHYGQWQTVPLQVVPAETFNKAKADATLRY